MPDQLHTMRQQLSAAIEATKGTAETLDANDVKLKPFREGFTYNPELQRFSNDQVADDLGQSPDFVSGTAGRIGFGTPLKTSGALATKPAIGIYLLACGAKEEQVKTITISAPSGGDGTANAGETIVSGGKTAIVEATVSGGGTLRYIPVSGGDLADTDVLTLGSDGDTATCSGASSDAGWRYSPKSQALDALTIMRGIANFAGTASKNYLWRLKGAMGSFQIAMAQLDAMRITAEFTGPVDFLGDGDLFTGYTYEPQSNANLTKLINAVVQIDGVLVRPSAINFDCGSQVILDPDPTTAGGADGYLHADISGREPSLTIDPYRMPKSDLDDLGKLQDGSEFPIKIQAGASPYQIRLEALKCQMREWSEAERAGKQAANYTIHILRDESYLDTDWRLYFE